MEDLAGLYDEFKKANCEIYAISTDTHFTHRAWWMASAAIRKIKFPMVGDPGHELSNQFGVLTPKQGLALRATFIINPEGEVEAMEIAGKGMGRNAAEILRRVQSARFMASNPDIVCPAKWKPGDEGIDVRQKIAEGMDEAKDK